MSVKQTLIPIYSTRGDLAAFLSYPYLINRQGEWIGWVNAQREVFSVAGDYIGWLAKEMRILRRESDSIRPRSTPPAPPPAIRVSAVNRLAPMMPELPFGTQDVLDECPDLLPPCGFGVYGKDLD
jgi:hypothetical protein